jgi:hypothetical protein
MLSTPVIALQWVVALFLTALGAIILYKIFTGQISMDRLLNESDGKASLSRLQLLIFTFMIASIYVSLCIQQGDLLEISNGVLGLMGVSGGSYVISKGIQKQTDVAKAAAAKGP